MKNLWKNIMKIIIGSGDNQETPATNKNYRRKGRY